LVFGALSAIGAGQAPSRELAGKRSDLDQDIAAARAVLAKPQVRKALKYVDEAESQKETVQQWVDLVNTYSPTGSEIYKARHLAKLFNIYGLEHVRIDDANNVIGVRPGTGEGPTIVLNAHFDAVALWPHDQPINGFVADGRVWGPAAADDLMGMQQVVTVLRALNYAKIQTKGDVWFVGFTGEEVGSTGVEHFVRANKHLLDWRKGAIIAQLHGGGGEGVSTGSYPYIDFAQLRFFTPLDRPRWEPHSVQALGRAIDRIYKEVYDPRSREIPEGAPAKDLSQAPLYLNMGIVQANPIHNGSVPQAWVRLDLRSPSKQRLLDAEAAIRRIAEQVCAELAPGCRSGLEVNMELGTTGIEGYDKADNRAARVGAAASAALYDTEPMIDAESGCGDCRRAYMGGVPAMSFRGNVRDVQGVATKTPRGGLESETRRRTAGHNVTESAEIDRIWSGIKHALAFVVTYSGIAESTTSDQARP
jgi:acetylornithine deacetylase/succinyl-diaminopimelate desuccinylase-like protein